MGPSAPAAPAAGSPRPCRFDITPTLKAVGASPNSLSFQLWRFGLLAWRGTCSSPPRLGHPLCRPRVPAQDTHLCQRRSTEGVFDCPCEDAHNRIHCAMTTRHLSTIRRTSAPSSSKKNCFLTTSFCRDS
jgi:hypothetical protein